MTAVGLSLRYNAGAIPYPHPGGQLSPGIVGIRDMLYGGNCYIAGDAPDGLVTVDGNPAQRIVRLIDRINGIMVRQVMSNADGSYRFDYIDGSRTWMVIGIDQYDAENAVIADLITAVPMPYVSPV